MSASINDKITAAENGGNPAPTTVSSARSIGGSTLSCVALTNWPTASAVHLITYQKNADNTMNRDTLCLWKGIVSGTTIGTLTLKGGTDAGNSVGDFVEMAPTSSQWQDLYDGLTQTLNLDGTLQTGIVATAKIADSAVSTAKIADSAVTPAKRSGGFKIGIISSTTLSTAGNKSITGVGFMPKLVRFTMLPSSSTSFTQIGFGAMTSLSQFYTAVGGTNTNIGRVSGTNAALANVDSTNRNVASTISYVSMDSDGFTVNLSASFAYDVAYEAYA